MAPQTRLEVLTRFDVGAFTCEEEITEVYLALGPEQFAVKAFLHFQQPGNGTRFFRRLLTQRLVSAPD